MLGIRDYLCSPARGLLVAGMIAFVGVMAIAQSGQGYEPAAKPSAGKKVERQKFMAAKLSISQELLRGVVLSDFDALQKSATAMNVLTLAEEWRVSDSEEYRRMSEDLRRFSRQLLKAGGDKDIEAATLAYQRMTLCCVECHRASRKGTK